MPISNVSRETLDSVFSAFEKHENQFSELIHKCLWWNRTVNLFSRNTDADNLKNHILHSLFLWDFDSGNRCRNVLDAGTGGGLPGLPLAICNPKTNFLLVDKSQKKTFVVRDLIRGLNISNATAVCSEIVNIRTSNTYHIVSKHAFHIHTLLSIVNNIDWKEIKMLKGEDVFSELNLSLLNRYTIDIKKIVLKENRFFQNKVILRIINNQ